MLRRLTIAFIICLIALGGYKQQIAINRLQNQVSWQLSDLVSRVMPSVVYIEATIDSNYYDEYEYLMDWSGSGVIIGPHTVLTAKHVIEDVNSLTITTVDGNVYEAREWKADPNNDCAILFFDDVLGPVAKFADSNKVEIGDKVIIIGSPYGLELFNTVTAGIVSGLNREILFFGEVPLITTDAASNLGNSGGPVFNMQGRIIGILVGGKYGADGLGIITPANACKEFYETTIKTNSEAIETGT